MDALTLAQEIIDGRRITREDDLSFFLTCDLKELCEGADKIRAARIGDKVDLCSIINGRSGRCPEDCKYCAQSAHNHTNCEVYDFLPEEDIIKACKMNESEGVDRFSIVTAGKALTGPEFEKAIHAFETMHRECKIDLCASMGFLDEEQLHRLHEAGVTSYHHNIETSRRNFPNICTTHTYDMKIETLKKVKAEGMCACSGGIIGMGETWEDRLDMAVSLAELGIDSIPINALMPIPGTPLENLPQLSEDDILRTIAETLLRLVEHRLQVECSVRLERSDLYIVAKEMHGEVAHLVTRLETSVHLRIVHSQFWMIYTQPQSLVALTKLCIFRFRESFIYH